MTWPGKTAISGHYGGRNGGKVLVGETMIPRTSTYEHAGDGGAPDALIRIEVRESRPEVVEVVLKAKPTGRGITSSDLGAFANLGNVIEHVMAELGTRVTLNPGGWYEGTQPQSDADRWVVRRDVHEARAQRRRGANEDELRQVAKVYAENAAAAPAQAVMDVMGYSRRTAARRIAAARDAGFLTGGND